MAIPETQLVTWSHQGSIQGSSETYNSVKGVLEAVNTPYSNFDYSVFLQGSYGNDTNIHTESDVDIIICLNSAFCSDKSNLNPDEIAAWRKEHSDATYTDVDFKKDVLKVLTDKYGVDVESGKKAIMIEANGSRRKTDVITALLYRRYYRFNGINDQRYDEGICFNTDKGIQISNYPKQHRKNLTDKNQGSSKFLKPMVRIMKNLRTKLIDDGLLDAGLAPSYFIEGLLYNVPIDKFHTNYGTCFINAIKWIQSETDQSLLVCANEQYYLLRDELETCWPISNANAFLEATVKLWNEW